MPVQEKEVKKTDDTRRYVIKDGDTLSKIAQQFYGDGSLWPKILEANRGVISDPNVIQPGQEIRIPPK